MSLYCEAFFADMELKDSEFVSELTYIAAKLTQQLRQQEAEAGPTVDLRFLLPKGVDKPDFTGMRLHSYDTLKQRLLIETVVPSALYHSARAKTYILAAMQDAVDNAADFFAEQKVRGYLPADEHERILAVAAA